MAKVAIPVGEDFEDAELTVPRDRLVAAGHEVVIVGDEVGRTFTGKRGHEHVVIEARAGDCDPESFDAVVIPGGYSPDHLRTDADVVRFVRELGEIGRTIAAVCHGPQLLIEADLVRGRTLTSWPSVRKDLINAGAAWVDRPVVEDANLITSRRPDDLEQFSDAILRRLARQHHEDAGRDESARERP
ncbi:type 1 glutamine amidotransferase [Candidatus Binatia bacterium]|jgi:protease I|nr:type 1 glutamine amidotransferase [Candidatus Binatia bacterium]